MICEFTKTISSEEKINDIVCGLMILNNDLLAATSISSSESETDEASACI